MNPRLRGLYVITDGGASGVAALADSVAAAVRGGARVVQYRDKRQDPQQRLAQARALLSVCRRAAVPLLINDDIDLAIEVDADGVHLGRDDLAITDARRRLAPGRLIGASCYNDFALARQAAEAGADYVAFGSFFASPTKPGAVRATPELLRRSRRELALPTVAIGGISPENGAALVAAGADMLAVVSAVFATADICAAAQAFSPLFDLAEETPDECRT